MLLELITLQVVVQVVAMLHLVTQSLVLLATVVVELAETKFLVTMLQKVLLTQALAVVAKVAVAQEPLAVQVLLLSDMQRYKGDR
jgi:hypothetical protein